MTPDNKILPLIFQHIRELADAQVPGNESDRFKIITPFPPAFNDFPVFSEEGLAFSDPEHDTVTAAKDTWHAYEFFTATNSLFYNYSYGIRSHDTSLSHVCKKLFDHALPGEHDNEGYSEVFHQKKDAFEKRFVRSTVGDLGNIDFLYTTPGQLQWGNSKVVLSATDCNRIREKALNVYKEIRSQGPDYIETLINEIEIATYSKIEYELGWFDVLRPWIDPGLFKSGRWKFRQGQEALYGENDPDFNSGDIRLCYSERFYLTRNWAGIPVESKRKTGISSMISKPGAVNPIIRDHRTIVRNKQLHKQLKEAERAANEGRQNKYHWVKDHWERTRINLPPNVGDPGRIFKTAAVKCRIISRKPGIPII